MAQRRRTRPFIAARTRRWTAGDNQLREVVEKIQALDWRPHPERLAKIQEQLEEIERLLRQTAVRWASQLRRIGRTRRRRPEWLEAIARFRFDFDIDHPVDIANALIVENQLTLGQVARSFGGNLLDAMELLAQGPAAEGPRVELLRAFQLRCQSLAAEGEAGHIRHPEPTLTAKDVTGFL